MFVTSNRLTHIADAKVGKVKGNSRTYHSSVFQANTQVSWAKELASKKYARMAETLLLLYDSPKKIVWRPIMSERSELEGAKLPMSHVEASNYLQEASLEHSQVRRGIE